MKTETQKKVSAKQALENLKRLREEAARKHQDEIDKAKDRK